MTMVQSGSGYLDRPKSSSLADLNPDQLRVALGLRPDTLLTAEAEDSGSGDTGVEAA